MSGHDRKADRRVDEASEDSFPASDPPSITPVTRAAEEKEKADSKARGRRTAEADQKERERDPHGIAPAETAAQGEPAGTPQADRQRTETERVDKP